MAVNVGERRTSNRIMVGPVRQEDWALGEVLWNYLRLGRPLVPTDAILVMGSNDLRVADRGAEVWRAGVSGRVVVSGGKGNFTRHWPSTEGAAFSERMVELGVPAECIVREERSTNTAENLAFSLRAAGRKGWRIRSLMLVHKPFMERRALATADVVCASVKCYATSPECAFADYPTESLPAHHILTAMVGDLERVLRYPELGWQSHQEVPDRVVRAYEELRASGYLGHTLCGGRQRA